MNRIESQGASGQEQRLSTQVDRHRWDAEWIAGQRLTTGVIRGGHRDGVADTEPRRALAARTGEVDEESKGSARLAESTTRRPVTAGGASDRELTKSGQLARLGRLADSATPMTHGACESEPNAAHSRSLGTASAASAAANANATAAVAAASAAAAAASAAVGATAATATASAGSGSEAAVRIAAGSAALAGTRPSFALWRTDDTVRLAMRLREPEARTSGILAQLRVWLRDAGLTLTQVIVNGRTREPDQKENASLNTRI